VLIPAALLLGGFPARLHAETDEGALLLPAHDAARPFTNEGSGRILQSRWTSD
jgi:hypothetical protein